MSGSIGGPPQGSAPPPAAPQGNNGFPMNGQQAAAQAQTQWQAQSTPQVGPQLPPQLQALYAQQQQQGIPIGTGMVQGTPAQPGQSQNNPFAQGGMPMASPQQIAQAASPTNGMPQGMSPQQWQAALASGRGFMGLQANGQQGTPQQMQNSPQMQQFAPNSPQMPQLNQVIQQQGINPAQAPNVGGTTPQAQQMAAQQIARMGQTNPMQTQPMQPGSGPQMQAGQTQIPPGSSMAPQGNIPMMPTS